MGDAALQKGAATNTWQDYAERLLAEYERRLEIKALPRTTPARRPEPALTLRA